MKMENTSRMIGRTDHGADDIPLFSADLDKQGQVEFAASVFENQRNIEACRQPIYEQVCDAVIGHSVQVQQAHHHHNLQHQTQQQPQHDVPSMQSQEMHNNFDVATGDAPNCSLPPINSELFYPRYSGSSEAASAVTAHIDNKSRKEIGRQLQNHHQHKYQQQNQQPINVPSPKGESVRSEKKFQRRGALLAAPSGIMNDIEEDNDSCCETNDVDHEMDQSHHKLSHEFENENEQLSLNSLTATTQGSTHATCTTTTSDLINMSNFTSAPDVSIPVSVMHSGGIPIVQNQQSQILSIPYDHDSSTLRNYNLDDDYNHLYMPNNSVCNHDTFTLQQQQQQQQQQKLQQPLHQYETQHQLQHQHQHQHQHLPQTHLPRKDTINNTSFSTRNSITRSSFTQPNKPSFTSRQSHGSTSLATLNSMHRRSIGYSQNNLAEFESEENEEKEIAQFAAALTEIQRLSGRFSKTGGGVRGMGVELNGGNSLLNGNIIGGSFRSRLSGVDSGSVVSSSKTGSISGKRRSRSDMAAAAKEVADMFEGISDSDDDGEDDAVISNGDGSSTGKSVLSTSGKMKRLSLLKNAHCQNTASETGGEVPTFNNENGPDPDERPKKRLSTSNQILNLSPKLRGSSFSTIATINSTDDIKGLSSNDNSNLREGILHSDAFLAPIPGSNASTMSAAAAAIAAADAADSMQRRSSLHDDSSSHENYFHTQETEHGENLTKNNMERGKRKMKRRAAFCVSSLETEAAAAQATRMQLLIRDRYEAHKIRAANGNFSEPQRRSLSYTSGVNLARNSIINTTMPEGEECVDTDTENNTDFRRLSQMRMERRVLSLPDPNAINRLSASNIYEGIDLHENEYPSTVSCLHTSITKPSQHHFDPRLLIESLSNASSTHKDSKVQRGEVGFRYDSHLNHDSVYSAMKENDNSQSLADAKLSSNSSSQDDDSFDGTQNYVSSINPRTVTENAASIAIHKGAEENRPDIDLIINRHKISTRLLLNMPNEPCTGDVAIHVATRKCNLMALKKILDADKDSALIRNEVGHCSLHIAAKNGHFAAVAAICLICPDSSRIQCEEGCLPLHYSLSEGAQYQDAPQIVALLLHTFSRSVNMTTDEGLLPVHISAMSGFAAGLRTLLSYSHETIFARENTELMLPLDFATDGLVIRKSRTDEGIEENDMPDLSSQNELLAIAQQQPVETELSTDVKSDFSKCIDILLMSTLYNVPILSPRDPGERWYAFLPLHGLIKTNPLLRTWTKLIALYGSDHCCDIDSNGMNPIHLICTEIMEEDRKMKMIESLCSLNKKNFVTYDKNGLIPLHYAILEQSHTHDFIIKVMECNESAVNLEVKGDSNKINFRNMLPFQLAATKNCHLTVIMTLLRSNPSGIMI